MAAEIRVDTIKGRAGINTLSFAGDGFSFDKNVGIGTTVVSDPVSANNPGKLAVGIVTCKEVYADGWNLAGIVTATGGIFNGDVTFTGATKNIVWDKSDQQLEINGDNSNVAKIAFGDSHDLQIYKTASGGNAFIHNAAGTLNITQNSGTIKIDKNTGDEMAHFNVDGSVQLFHNSLERVTTSADGADFGGTGCIGITKGTTGQRPGSPAAGDFRYNTTDGKFEGYTDEWGEIGGGGGAAETDTSVSSTSATSVYAIAHATYRSAYMVIQITQGSAHQVGRYLVIHDGTTATIVEESAVATGSMLGTFTADINGSNLRVLVNMGSASSATVTVLPNPVTV